jgi:hypothetical protein
MWTVWRLGPIFCIALSCVLNKLIPGHPPFVARRCIVLRMEGIEERLLGVPATRAWKKGVNVVINFLLKKNLSSTLSTKQNRSIEER